MFAQSQQDVLAEKFSTMFAVLDERQRRLYAAAEAISLGRGGTALVARGAGISEPMVRRGIRELRGGPPEASARVCKQGGGRKRLEQLDPALVADLEKLVSPDTRGDPRVAFALDLQKPAALSAALAEMGHSASPKASCPAAP